MSLIVLAIATPLLWRSFFRTVTAYQNLLRNNEIQKECWRYLIGQRTWAALARHIDLYFLQWRSPEALHSLMWANLKYSFFAIFLVAVAALVWAFVTAVGVIPRLVAATVLVVAFVWEVTTLWQYRRDFYREPSEQELHELDDLRCERPSTNDPTTLDRDDLLLAEFRLFDPRRRRRR